MIFLVKQINTDNGILLTQNWDIKLPNAFYSNVLVLFIIGTTESQSHDNVIRNFLNFEEITKNRTSL